MVPAALDDDAAPTTLSAAALLGLVVALVLPVVQALVIAPLLLEPRISASSSAIVSLAVVWGLAGCVLLVALRLEHLPPAAIGWVRLRARWVVVAVALGIALSLLVPVLSFAAHAVLPAGGGGSVGDVVARPWLLVLAAVLTAAVTEELLFRAYAMERLLAATGSRATAVVAPLAFFVLAHTAGWDLAHVFGVVLPLGLAFSLLYLWRRNLPFMMILHVLVDAPLVILAAVG